MVIVKITHIQLYPIMIQRRTGSRNLHVIVRLEAGESHVGWGEMSDLSHLPLYQFDLPALAQTLSDLLRGQDARNIAHIEDILIRYFPDEGHKYSRSGLVREGIDLALHDLNGRLYGVSTSTLLGGQLRDRFKVCYPIFRMRSESDTPANLERVQNALERGFDLIRVYVGANVDADALFLQRFAAQFGGRVQIKSLDFSNLLSWRQCLRAVERFADITEFMILESVAPFDDLEGMAALRRRSRWPVSEHVTHLQHAWRLLHTAAVDILNVSPYVLGGLRACQRVIGLAEAAHVGVLIGTTQELNLGTAAVAHLGAAARVLDYPSDNTGPELYTDDVVKRPLTYENGYLIVPEGVGLGLEVDEKKLTAQVTQLNNPFGTDLAGLLDRTAPAEEATGQ
jgi:L-alanine-DL-glutamate epimerase-like enolase superfamily enzyme